MRPSRAQARPQSSPLLWRSISFFFFVLFSVSVCCCCCSRFPLCTRTERREREKAVMSSIRYTHREWAGGLLGAVCALHPLARRVHILKDKYTLFSYCILIWCGYHFTNKKTFSSPSPAPLHIHFACDVFAFGYRRAAGSSLSAALCAPFLFWAKNVNDAGPARAGAEAHRIDESKKGV